MIILSPSILSADFAHLGEDVERSQSSGAQYLHLDVMDGMFVPNISIGVPVIATLRKHTETFFDTHLMINDPVRYIEAFANAGSDLITFHVEAAPDCQAVIDKIRSFGKKVGITLNPATPLSEIEPYLDQVDMVLVMTVVPGYGGQSYIPSSTQKIMDLKKMRDDRGLSFDIEVDGGIKASNVRTVLEAGANVIVAGSAVYGGDIEGKVKEFMEIFKEYED
ncbi:MAG: ribulose-phosphate 3-epimerase [Lachnospiraceae bacterium]|nr:ribulose-phosphate 3-epimerase [Candidatus Equihabitans merdae]